jgi:hypothetical protein
MHPPPPNKRVTEIHLSLKDLNVLLETKFQWDPSHCGVLGNVIADYLVKTARAISPTSARKLSFHSAKLRIKSNVQADFSTYATESQHKPWNKMAENRNIIPDFPRGHAVATNHWP